MGEGVYLSMLFTSKGISAKIMFEERALAPSGWLVTIQIS